MLSLDDPKWKSLHGGYRIPYDATGALRRLYANEDVDAAWAELWEDLHHQGDVGESSYAAVPHLVEILRTARSASWNGYSLIATIEIERHRRTNPKMPDWAVAAYESAWNDLLQIALADFGAASDPGITRAILGVLALCKGMKEIGRVVSYHDESEIEEIFGDQ